MTTILAKIVAQKRTDVELLKKSLPVEVLREQVQAAKLSGAMPSGAPPTDFAGALRGLRPREADADADVRIIAEIKRRSPSKGEFPWHGDAARQARAYEQGGARAVSVVTDGPFFGGTPDLLRQVKAAVALPVLQKDFLLDPYQITYAAYLGADAVLLIAAILPGGKLADMTGLAREAGLATLVEVVDNLGLERAISAGAEVIGVNNRDLRTFRTDPARTLELLPGFGEHHVAVTESGIHTREDILRMQAAGVDAFLIGEALMTAPDPTAHLQVLRGAALSEAAS